MKTLARDERKPYYKRLLLAGAATTIVTLTLSLFSCLDFGPSEYGQDWSGYYPSYPGGSYWGDQYRPMRRDRHANRIMPNRQYRPNGANKQNRSSPQYNRAGKAIKKLLP
jgi:hypothetical protein